MNGIKCVQDVVGNGHILQDKFIVIQKGNMTVVIVATMKCLFQDPAGRQAMSTSEFQDVMSTPVRHDFVAVIVLLI